MAGRLFAQDFCENVVRIVCGRGHRDLLRLSALMFSPFRQVRVKPVKALLRR
jgi:hypothetical protein